MAKAKGETSYSRNYSIGSRDMATAGQMVVEQRFHGGFQSKRDIGQRWAYFCKWAEPQGIKRMEKISKELVIEYGQSLQQELDAGERKSPSSPKNYVSAVNTVMRLATRVNGKPSSRGKIAAFKPGRISQQKAKL